MSDPKPSDSRPGTKGKALVYVVDDEPMVLELATVILEPLGIRIQTFRAPEVALRAYRAEPVPPALVITDYAMHTMTGLDLIEACRQIQPRQKILLLSGTVGERILQGVACQPDRFLAKPYQAKQLLEVVRELLSTQP
jgi:CheY-like chemotaxis protein